MVLCGRRVTGFGLACWLWVVALSAVTIAEQVWSPWYNSSPGPVETIENETLDRIAMIHQLPCGVEGVVAVQCRVAGSNVTFSGQGRHGGNVLHVPCNLTGLLCRPEDQVAAEGGPCADYELRVLCLIHDEGSRPRPSNNNDNSNMEGANNMGIKGGFTALVAGASVVIPLACVLVFQLRKYKREERQRQRQARQAAEDLARANEAARATDAPPAYEDLFGSPPPATGPLSVISSGVLLEDPASREEAEARRSGTERLLLPGSFPERLEGRINPGASLDVPESARTGASPTVGLTSSSPSSVSGGGSPNAGPTGPSPSSGSTVSTSVSSSVSSARLSSVSSSSSSTSTSTDVFLPPGSSSRGVSGGDDTHPGPPPAYDWPGPAQHVTITVPEGGSGTSGRLQSSGPLISAVSPSAPVVVSSQPASSGEAPGRRRFLGMHLSIFDLMAAIYPDPASTPPPTYDDALKILEASKQHQVHVT